jgi:hypothetical protein
MTRGAREGVYGGKRPKAAARSFIDLEVWKDERLPSRN